MTSENPWHGLDVPSEPNLLNARRVSTESRWHFYWGMTGNAQHVLVLGHSVPSASSPVLPKVEGIEISIADAPSGGGRMLLLKLLDERHREIFYRLCQDIVSYASIASTEEEALRLSVIRTWRWHHLLRGGSDDMLSDEEQKGLIGELFVLERYVMQALAPIDAVASWMGPLRAAKDFEVGRVSIEAKARRGSAKPFISISSEHQLDTADRDSVFLYVVTLDRANAGSGGRFSITDLAEGLRRRLENLEPLAAQKFGTLLSAAGYRREDDYTKSMWIEGQSRLYELSEGFPRLAPHMLMLGVSKVTYSIALSECARFAVPNDKVISVLAGA